ncbi:uncharacterized protein LOC132557697 [Ylistrum balloti]|uniref:uncharacterized protein LOC132557697 n=1 Tax=Ylistrum balloti TaxID=509963 RepID=UPI002905EAA1|nr:uncharacterized protein LOC132557697 [Ylistrum balloti]
MANAQLNFKFIRNRLGGNNLSYNGYLYRIRSSRGERTYWRCTITNCLATINTRNNIIVGVGRQPHNHPGDHASIVAKEIMNCITDRCQKEIRPIPTIYSEELCKLRDNEWDEETRTVVEKIPTFNSKKSQLYRARRKLTPKLPTTTQDIDLEGRWTETNTGERFLHIDDGDQNRILVFATSEDLAELATADRIYCDGTFYTCPNIFHQIYTIHIEIDGSMYPVVYSLLPGKSQHIYTRFFTLLKTFMADNHLPMSPDTVFVDFETAVHNAIRTVFPGTDIKGCFFHYTQCVWRKALMTGLQLPYRDNEDIRRLVRRAAVLPLVPEQQVEDVWFHALQDIEYADLPADVTPFTDYVVDQWVDGDRPVWNHYDNDGPRTTNHLEAWHGKLKKIVQHAHPNIFEIIQTFKDIQATNEIARLQRRAGGTRRPRPKRYRNIDTRLALLKQRLESNTIDIIAYADAASELLHLG